MTGGKKLSNTFLNNPPGGTGCLCVPRCPRNIQQGKYGRRTYKFWGFSEVITVTSVDPLFKFPHSYTADNRLPFAK